MTWNRKSDKKKKRKNQYFQQTQYITTRGIVKKISNAKVRSQEKKTRYWIPDSGCWMIDAGVMDY